MKQFLLGMGTVVVLGLLLVLALTVGGYAPITAVPAESGWWRNLVHSAYESALARRAQGVSRPQGWNDAARARAGAAAFDDMCASCHTPPGHAVSVQVQGMNPAPPRLDELLHRRTPAEAFYVLRHGVRMTGMPAFGPTHSDGTLWELVAFLEAARDLDTRGYRKMVAAGRGLTGDDGHDHSHGPGGGRQSGADSGRGDDGHDHDHDHGEDDKDSGGHHGDMGAGGDGAELSREAADETGDAHAMHSAASVPAEQLSPAQVSDALFAALVAADTDRVRRLLHPQVLIFEQGGQETGWDEYSEQHLAADIAFARTASAQRAFREVWRQGNAAVVATRSDVESQRDGQTKNYGSTETLLLRRGPEGWRVAHIHWSSRAMEK